MTTATASPTTATCRCGRLTRDAAYVCETCLDELARALGEIPWLATELETTITRQRALPTEGGASSTNALPWNEAAAEAREHLKAILVSWTLFCDAEQVRTRPAAPTTFPEDDLEAISRWLIWRVDGLGLLDIGPAAVDEITNATAACRRLIDRPPERWFAGPCECGTDLYATSREGVVTCHGCGAQHDVASRREWLLEAAEDWLAPAPEVARAITWLGGEQLTSDRIRKWAERGKLPVRGHVGKRALYRIGDAIDMLTRHGETRRSKAG